MISAQQKAAPSLALLVEAALFTVFVPGTVTVWLPFFILLDGMPVSPATWGPLQFGALPLAGVGLAVYFWCLWDFVAAGRGIPLPLDHPRRLVVRGLYRYVRNPMYLGVLCVLLAEVSFFRSTVLLLYTIGWFVIVHAFVVLYEEPTLRRKFGDEYDRYVRSVRRWLPGRPSGGHVD